jgi:ribosomal protein S27AE
MGTTSPQETKRRLDALEKTKRTGQVDGSVTEAADILGDVSASTLSRWLLMRKIKVGRNPRYSKEECIAELRRLIKELGRIPVRDDWRHVSPQGVGWRTHWRTYESFLAEAGPKPQDARILLLDIETAPNRAWFWGEVWKQNINPDWIDANGYVLCWTAKWLGETDVVFHRLRNKNHKSLLSPMHKLLHEASAVVHYNGIKFDMPTLNKEFLLHGFTPPSPYKQIDLLPTMREQFKFPSNKLDYICKTLGLGEKLRHEGPQLWMDCMEDDPKAWAKMEAYNRRDVELLEVLYKKLLPWIKKHPNRAAMSGFKSCPSCGSFNYGAEGSYLANQLRYERYKCGDCGTWFRGTKSINPRREERVALTA